MKRHRAPLATVIAVVGLFRAATAEGDHRLWVFGKDSGDGLLANRTSGVQPWEPADPSRPTLVVIHGLNPGHRAGHFRLGEAYAQALAATGCEHANVLEWNWGNSSFTHLSPKRNQAEALRQGELLAHRLLESGLSPESIEIVGHSSGAIVAASAASVIHEHTGSAIAKLTLLDAAAAHHELVFGSLRAAEHALVVENRWADGPSGFGKPAEESAVANTRVEPSTGWRGFLNPLKSDHLNTVRYHVEEYPATVHAPQGTSNR